MLKIQIQTAFIVQKESLPHNVHANYNIRIINLLENKLLQYYYLLTFLINARSMRIHRLCQAGMFPQNMTTDGTPFSLSTRYLVRVLVICWV